MKTKTDHLDNLLDIFGDLVHGIRNQILRYTCAFGVLITAILLWAKFDLHHFYVLAFLLLYFTGLAAFIIGGRGIENPKRGLHAPSKNRKIFSP